MQPKMCCKCKKNVAVIFITKVENGVTLNEAIVSNAPELWAFRKSIRP